MCSVVSIFLHRAITSFRLFIPCIFCTYCNKVTNGCNCLFCVFISFIFTLHVSGSHKPIIRGISSCSLYTTIWFIWCLCCSSACACGLVCLGGFTVLLICVCLWTGLSWWFHCTAHLSVPVDWFVVVVSLYCSSVCACGLVCRGGFTVPVQ